MSPQGSIMMGTVQSVALKGRPGHRSWWRGREVRASPEDMQELLPTPLEMHKVGAGLGTGGLDTRPGAVRTHRGLQMGFILLHHHIGILYQVELS